MSAFKSRHLAVIVGLLTAACSGSNSPRGTWLTENGETKLEFLDKGEIYMTGPEGTFAGKWEVSERGQVKIVFVGRGAELGEQICNFEIKKKVLTLSGECVLEGSYQARA
jgi:hypothetical protein